MFDFRNRRASFITSHASTTNRKQRPRGRRAALARFQIEALEPRVVLSTINWINPRGGDWDTPSNWSGGVLPGPSDTAVIGISGITVTHNASTTDVVGSLSSKAAVSLSAGTLSLGSNSTISNTLTIAGGNLTGPGNLSVNSLLWSTGTMSGPGTTTVVAGGTLTFRANGSRLLDGRTLNNAGTASWSGSGNINMADGAAIDNLAGATFSVLGNATLASAGGAATSFMNAGTFQKTTLIGTTTVNVPFTNTGTVSVQTGSLVFHTDTSTTGHVVVTSGSTVVLSGGNDTFGLGSSITGPGLTQITAGATVAVTGASSASNLELDDNGTLMGAGTLTATGMLTLTGGTIAGPGTVVAEGGLLIGSTDPSNAQEPYFTGGTIVNQGAATFGNALLRISGGATIDNAAGATFKFLDDSTINNGSGAFVNEGTLIKAGGDGTASIGIPIANSGAVQVQSGTLSLGGGGSGSGAATFGSSDGATLIFGGNETYSLGDGTAITGDGASVEYATLSIDGAVSATDLVVDTWDDELTGAGTLTVSGMLTWTTGYIAGPGTVVTEGGLLIGSTDPSNAQEPYFTGGTIVNEGTATFGNALLRISGGATIDNAAGATFEFLDDSTINNGNGQLVNDGALIKGGGTGTASFAIPIVEDGGSIAVDSGTLELGGGGTITGGAALSASAGATLGFGGSNGLTIDATCTLTAAGTVMAGGVVTDDGSYSAVSTVVTGQLYLNGPASTSALLLAGTLGGSATIDVTGPMTWTGTVSGPGTVVAEGGLLIGSTDPSNAQEPYFTGGTIVNQGAATFGNALLRISGGATIDNAAGATFEFLDDSTINNGSGAFTNEGTLIKAGGDGTASIGIPIANSGAVEALSGTLGLGGGGSSSGAATFGAWDGGELLFEGSSFSLGDGTAIVGDGASVEYATLSIDGAVSATDLVVDTWDDELTGAGTLTVSGMLTWTTGYIAGPGTVVTEGGLLIGSTDPSNAQEPYFTGGTIVNEGTATFGNALLRISGGATIDNAAGATFEFLDDSTINNGNGQLVNDGAIIKAGGTGTASLGIPIANSGSILALSGTLSLGSGGSSSGAATFGGSDGGILIFVGSATYSLGDDTAIVGDGVVINNTVVSIDGKVTGTVIEFEDGVITGTGTITVGDFTWTGGTFSGNGQMTVTGTLDLPGDARRTILTWTVNTEGTTNLDATGTTQIDGTWNNSGTIDWNGSGNVAIADAGLWNNTGTIDWNGTGNLTLNQGALYNAGTLLLAGAGSLSLSDYSEVKNFGAGIIDVTADQSIVDVDAGAASAFENSASIVVEAGSGTLSLQVAVTDTGSMSILAGTVSMPGGLTAEFATFDVSAGATLLLPTAADSIGSATISGDGTTVIDGATVAIDGSVSVANLAFESGDITGPGVLSVADLTWTGGRISDGASVIVTGKGAILTQTSIVPPTVDGSTFLNDGAMTITDHFVIQDHAVVTNAGTLSLSGYGSLKADFSTFVNSGEIDSSDSAVITIGSLTLDNLGTINWASSGDLEIETDDEGNPVPDVPIGTLVNVGTVTWTGSGGLTSEYEALFDNQSGGQLNLESEPAIDVLTFQNEGTITKTADAGTITIDSDFTNTGTVNVDSGTLALVWGQAAGSFRVETGATLEFTGGTTDTFYLGAGTTLTGGGLTAIRDNAVFIDGATTATNLELDSGAINGDSDLNVLGTFTWTGGSMGGNGITNIAPSGTLDVAGGSDYTGFRTINNEGANISSDPSGVFVSTDNSFSDLSTSLAKGLLRLQSYLDATTFHNPVPLLGNGLGSAGVGQVVDHILADLTSPISGTHLLAVQEGLFDILGPSGLNLLTDANNDGYINLNDVEVVNTGGEVSFQVILHEAASANTGEIGFALGLPGLPFSVSSSAGVTASAGFDLDVTFGVRQLAGQSPSPFVDPSTLEVEVNAGAGLSIGGTLGLLQATVADDPTNPSSFVGDYQVAFSDEPGAGFDATLTLSGQANLNLDVSAGFGAGAFDPRLSAVFNLSWGFSNADTADFPFGDTPTIAFNDVQLDLGAFLTGFLSPLVGEIQHVTKPLEPLAEFLTAQIPFLSQISQDLGNGPQYFTQFLFDDSSTADELAAFGNAIETINGLSIPSSSAIINLGSFTLTDPRQTSTGGGADGSTIDTADPSTDVSQQIESDDPNSAGLLQSLADLGDGSGFDFPILDDPTNAFDLFMGINTTLFTYTMPTLTISTGAEEDIPTPVPFVDFDFSGFVTLSFSGSFGYDTTGLVDGNPADGFFVQNVQASLSLDMGAGFQVGAGAEGGLSIGPEGDIDGTVNFDLVGPGNSDIVYGSQLDAGDFSIDTSGSIVASASLDIKGPPDPVTGKRDVLFSQDWGSATIFSWGN